MLASHGEYACLLRSRKAFFIRFVENWPGRSKIYDSFMVYGCQRTDFASSSFFSNFPTLTNSLPQGGHNGSEAALQLHISRYEDIAYGVAP